MRKVFVTFAVLLLAGTTAFAQTAQGVVVQQTRLQGPPGAPIPSMPDGNFLFVAAEGFEGKVVKGAPYSGEAVTEHVQVLADGNRIVNRFASVVYRDSEGRTRREQTLKGLNNVLGNVQEPMQIILINDPVAGVTYSLDSKSHTAIKSIPFKIELGPKGAAGADVEGRRFEFKVAPPSGNTGTMIVTSPAGSPAPPPEARIQVQRTEQIIASGTAGAAYSFRRTEPSPNASKVTQELGKQLVEGVEAEGKRTTITIPAGEMGNERPIEIVHEQWYSPELQLMVMTRTSDPRTGETTYKLTNINRTEPAKTLFEVPSDYTVRDSLHIPGGPLVPRTRKLVRPEEQ